MASKSILSYWIPAKFLENKDNNRYDQQPTMITSALEECYYGGPVKVIKLGFLWFYCQLLKSFHGQINILLGYSGQDISSKRYYLLVLFCLSCPQKQSGSGAPRACVVLHYITIRKQLRKLYVPVNFSNLEITRSKKGKRAREREKERNLQERNICQVAVLI